MNKNLQVLKLLSKNKTVSGESIAKLLGISRNMVWKIINSLNQEGYTITSSTKGYSLIDFPQKLTAEQLLLYTNESFDIKVFDELSSTNTYCHDNVDSFEKNTLIIALSQSAGKGRLNRTFLSPNGGLYMSFCFKQSLPIELSPHVTLYTAVAVAKAIESICKIDVAIKWVNDLFVEDKKICGILSEASISCEEKIIKHFTVGIGINVNNQTMPKEIKDIASSLQICTNKSVNMTVLATEIIKNMQNLPNDINSNYLEEYRKRCFIIGKTVYVQNQPALVISVNDDCSLQVQINGEIKNLYAGEVTLKLQQN